MDIPSAGSSADLYKSAITKSIQSIALDDTLSPEEKEAMIEKSLAQYHDKMMELTQAAEEPPAQENPISKSDPDRFVEIIEVEKFNPYHDAKGRFASANSATSFTHRTKDPSKQHWADAAAAREKERTAGMDKKPEAKVVPFTPAKTKKEAVKYAQDQLGFTKVSYGTKLDIDTINHINEQIAQVQSKYPEVKGAVSEIRTWSKQGVYAAIETNAYGSMAFLIGTQQYGKGMDSVNKSYERDLASGFHPAGTTAASIVHHEYGHVLANMSAKKKAGIAANGTTTDSSKAKTFAQDRRSSSTEKQWLFDAAKSTGQKPSEMMKNVSRYAQKNPGETFAEAFAEVMTSASPRKEAVAIVEASGWKR